ncbi:MAG TPA: hypothetical protein VJT31_04470 [Rugosimonospora sp.]|nr:hypothetical protein [Rugosimonospora sp.]
MRHLGSLFAGIVAVPVGWLLLAFGQTRSATVFAAVPATGAYHPHDYIRPLIFLAAAGVAIGLVASLRISPLGPLVAGIVYAGSYVALLFEPKRVYDALNYNVKIAGQHADLTLPLTTGTTLAIGAVLLVAVLSVGRWRRWPRPAAAEPALVAEPEDTTLTDETLGSSWNAFSSTPSPSPTTPLVPAAPLAPSTAQPVPATSELPVRTPAATWPAAREGQEETTGSVPAKGRSPWDTPLRDTNGNP